MSATTNDTYPDGVHSITCVKCTNGNKATINFPDGTFTFWSQWLHDARFDKRASRNAETAICQQPNSLIQLESVEVSEKAPGARFPTLNATWKNGDNASFPLPWLRVMASLVGAETASEGSFHSVQAMQEPRGWTVDTLKIPEVSYTDLFDENVSPQELETTILRVLDLVLGPSAHGIVKIIDLPDPNVEDERNNIRNINTAVLKRIFGSVFVHPIRGSDKSFNVSSHGHSATRNVGIPNYDTTQVLLPHTDHAFYDNPIQVQGFYGLEGTSENTWVSSLKVLETFRKEDPEAYQHLCNAPVAFGRVSQFYGEPLYQSTLDTAVTKVPGFHDQVKRLRWHPNMAGYLCSDYENYKAHRLAHQKFQEVMRRPMHQLKRTLRPGDLYLWDNFRLLHGREKVLTNPRTGVGQTVPEHIVHDRYRALCINAIKDHIDGDWLCHMPMQQLRELVGIVREAI